jgi:peptidoglycan hydrolase-like protein with peptidoglycan-binding domain
MRVRVVTGVLALALVAAATAESAPRSGVAALQVALRAHGLYGDRIDGVAGPATQAAVVRFQARAGLAADGVAGPLTRKALGRLGRPLLGKRVVRPGLRGWDVSALQFLLGRRGFAPGAVDGEFGPATLAALVAYQSGAGLAADGLAGPATLRALAGRRQPATPLTHDDVRALIDAAAVRYGVRAGLVRALAWQESGFQAHLVSSAGASGVMQVIPSTWAFVEEVLLGRRVPQTTPGNVEVGTALLGHLVREFGNERQALAAYYQGAQSVRRDGVFSETARYVANVLALVGRV